MPTYTYKARDVMGQRVEGAMEAATKDELTNKLRKMGYMTTRVTESLPSLSIEAIFARFKRISAQDMITFNVQFADLINAGLSVLSSLNTILERTEGRKLKEVLLGVSREVEAGESLSEAFSKHPKVFPKLYVSLVRAGEASGRLDTILERLAAFSEREEELKRELRGALFYPVILLVAGLLVTLSISTFLIPKFADIFTSVGLTLPLPTMILSNVGTGIQHYWYWIAIFASVICLSFGSYTTTPKGRVRLDRWKLNAPLVGPLYRKVAIARFSRTLGMLVSSGVPILESLDIVRDVVGNEILGGVIGNARTAVEKGERISDSLGIGEEFPSDTIRMIAVGEETGNLDKMLAKIADFYDRSVAYSIKKLITLLEPVLLIFLSVLVAFIMLSMLLPMFDMIKVVRLRR